MTGVRIQSIQRSQSFMGSYLIGAILLIALSPYSAATAYAQTSNTELIDSYKIAEKDASAAATTAQTLGWAWTTVAVVCTTACVAEFIDPTQATRLACSGTHLATSIGEVVSESQLQGMYKKDFNALSIVGMVPPAAAFANSAISAAGGAGATKIAVKGAANKASAIAQKLAPCLSAAMAVMQSVSKFKGAAQARAFANTNRSNREKLEKTGQNPTIQTTGDGGYGSGVAPIDGRLPASALVAGGANSTANQPQLLASGSSATRSDPCASASQGSLPGLIQCASKSDPAFPVELLGQPSFQNTFKQIAGLAPEQFIQQQSNKNSKTADTGAAQPGASVQALQKLLGRVPQIDTAALDLRFTSLRSGSASGMGDDLAFSNFNLSDANSDGKNAAGLAKNPQALNLSGAGQNRVIATHSESNGSSRSLFEQVSDRYRVKSGLLSPRSP